MKILLTGGAGYIGSHTLCQVLQSEHEVCVFDNFSQSHPEALKRVKRITNRDFRIDEGDIRDRAHIYDCLSAFQPDVVIHFAGLKAVGESTEQPINYYETNVFGSLQLLKAMDATGVKNIVFSSTATVYGIPEYLPYDENHPLQPESPYGRSKLMVENMLADWSKAAQDATSIVLRYFNPVGAHISGEIGEDPQGIPNNLMPFIQQVAIGRRQKLTVYGNDYNTPDGTGIRDYIHVEDLANAHLAAVNFSQNNSGHHVFNVGTGQGHSVLEVIDSFERRNKIKVPYTVGDRRDGDVPEMAANVKRAKEILKWNATRNLDDMTRSAWHFQTQNPNGYKK